MNNSPAATNMLADTVILITDSLIMESISQTVLPSEGNFLSCRECFKAVTHGWTIRRKYST